MMSVFLPFVLITIIATSIGAGVIAESTVESLKATITTSTALTASTIRPEYITQRTAETTSHLCKTDANGAFFKALSRPVSDQNHPHWHSSGEHKSPRVGSEAVDQDASPALAASSIDRAKTTASTLVSIATSTSQSAKTTTKIATINESICSGTTNSTTTVTASKDTRCAPTNLISSIGRFGIRQIQPQADEVRLSGERDASACCQSCVDTEACAAMSFDRDAGNCFLYFTVPACGMALRYSAGGGQVAPGEGIFVQAGCGSVEPV